MDIGIPKETRPSEYRAGLTPAGVRLLTRDGHTCYVEHGTGHGAGFADEHYEDAGAVLVYSGEEAFRRGALILKVTRPTNEELAWLSPGQALMGFLHLKSAQPEKLRMLNERDVTTIAYEKIQLDSGELPVLKPLSQIGGRMAAQLAASLSQNDRGGRGVLIGGVPGVPAAEVVIIGAGVVGEEAARALLGMGAQVTILNRGLDRLQEIDAAFPGRVNTLVSHAFNIERACSYADIVIGAVHIPGERAPIVIPEAVVRKMRPGAVLLDMSIDEGGCAETSRPTSHENPTYVEHDMIHCCIPNLPGVVARTATHAFLNAAWPYIRSAAGDGVEAAIKADPALARGVVTPGSE